jgi:hypothetical protein
MRDGLISVLAGHFLYERPGWGVPLMMFKATYYVMSWAWRLGLPGAAA